MTWFRTGSGQYSDLRKKERYNIYLIYCVFSFYHYL